MILAAPLVIPFAKALGLSVGVLGLAALSDKVNQFIQDNPEESMKILSTIIPGAGIGQIFMNKEEKISLEDLDGMSDEEAQDLSKEDKAELMKQAGKSGSKDKRQTMIDISEKLGLSGEGKDKQDIEYEIDERYDEGGVEEVSKPKFDYKKFFKKRYADGGAIGIEVLFEEKKPRKDFNIGGNVQRVTTPQPYDARASAADFARAIDRVGAGTDMQKAMAIQEYGQNVQRQNMLSKIKDAGTNLAMQVYGLNPTKAGIAQDPSMLEFQEIKTAGLPQKDYSAASTYGMLEDITEGNPITRALAGTAGLVALPANEVLRPAYDLMQGVYKGITDPNKSIPQAIKDEKIPEMLAGSRKGVLQFIGDQFGLTNNRQDIVDSITKPSQTRTPLSESDFYSQFYGVPYQGFENKFFKTVQKGDPNYDAIRAASSAGSFSDLVDRGIIQAYTGPTDYKNYLSTFADGGRVGLFMGGDPLTGQALAIYNSMNAYGFSDQEIANALEGQGLYTPSGGTTTPDAPTTVQPIGYQGRSDDNPYAGQVVDQTDYSFNKKNYAPGEKLEINPEAVGMSFYDSTTGTSTPNKTVKEDKGIIGRTIDSFMGAAIPEKQLSQFTSPTTGATLTGPAELGFMTQNIEGIPGNLTRDDLRSMYDNYNKFLGRSSNFANARVKGPASDLINLIPVVGSAARMFGSGGDKSLQSKYTVDGAGFGNTGARDEFGLGTFDAKDGFLGLTGNTTRNYVDRMQDKLGELEDFFGSRIDGFDINNLDAATLSKMKGINSFYAKQIQAYQQRLATEKLNEQIRKQKEIEAEKALAKSYNIGQRGGGAGDSSTSHMGGISQAQADAVGKANKEAGMTGWGLRDGGLATMFKEKR